jgi:putative multiple sugar transport system substrate-binding protein
MKRFIAGILICMMAVSFAACGSNKDKESASKTPEVKNTPVQKKVIGISMPTQAATRWINDGNSMVKQFEEKGYTCELKFGEDVVENQVKHVKEMINKNVSCLIITAIDGQAFTDVLKAAGEKKIPVIAYDRLLKNTGNIDYYATFDNFKVGVIQAEDIEKRLKLKEGKGPFNIELFAGSLDDNNSFMFFDGSMSILKPYIEKKTLVVKSQQMDMQNCATARWDGPTAKSRLDTVLSSYYKDIKIDAVLSPYDGISRGILASLKSVGYGAADKPYPIVTGQDAELDSVKLVMTGEQTSTVFKDTRVLAKRAVNMTLSLLDGKKVEVNDEKTYNNGAKVVPSYLEVPVLVDKDNYKKELVDTGYYTEDKLK